MDIHAGVAFPLVLDLNLLCHDFAFFGLLPYIFGIDYTAQASNNSTIVKKLRKG